MNETIKLSRRQASKISQLCEAYYSARTIQGGSDTPERITARKNYAEESARLAKYHFGLKLGVTESFRAVAYHQTDWVMRNPGSMEERLDCLAETLRTKKQIDQDQPFGECLDPKNLFSTLYFMHDYRLGNRTVLTTQCGGSKTRDTAKSLYRLLFLTKPDNLDFSDMYKTGGFIDLLSNDGSFVAHVELWKYELMVRFSASKEHVSGHRHAITCGIPTADNGIQAQSPLLKKWCSTLILALNSKWDVYSGNNFVV
jgi:hypothetical protein